VYFARAGALPDEMRRRLEPRPPVNAAARQERNLLFAEEPPCGFGCVARIGILGEQADERAAPLLVQRGEQQRQRRLGHARRRGECTRVGGQALFREQLLDERMKDGSRRRRLVHDERRNRPVPRHQS
jgi:hypothetical protein